MTTTHLDELRAQARPWLGRAPRSWHTVVTGDEADEVILDGLMADCAALRQLAEDLPQHYGAAPGLVEDLWRAAYGRRPQVLEPDEVAPQQRVNREICAAQLGSPEHTELRRVTQGDAYAAAMAVLAQGPRLRKLLTCLAEQQEQARQAQRQQDAAERAAAALAQAMQAAADVADEKGRVPGAQAEQVQAALTAVAVAAEAAEQAADAVADALAVAPVRAAARAAAAAAVEEVETEQQAMAAWGVGEGELDRLDAGERMRLAEKLRSGKLARFAELIGRFKQLAQAQRSRRVEHARGEYVGVTLGDDLGSLIPSELVGLAVPALRAEFAARYAERQLMVYDQRGEDHEGQGAIIAVIDCSSSMQTADERGYTREAYAKALALSLLDQARAARPTRDFAAVLFADDVDVTLRFPAEQPVQLADKVELAERNCSGGTDFEGPLTEALRLLEAEYNATGRMRADIVLITDGEAPITNEWLQVWRETKRRLAARCFGVEIGWPGEQPAPQLTEICDDVRQIEDLTDTHATAACFRAI